MRWSGNLEPVFYASWVSLILLPLIKLYVLLIRAHVDLFATYKVLTEPALFQKAPAFRNRIHCLLSSVNKSEAESICDATAMHIAMTLDAVYLRGLIAAILSIVQHSDCPPCSKT
ncbi:hypothetical protein O6H91_08G015400 [Diphasiastrum complanatum]|uniref:Uncharacterized protein n=1 Tax=Diphasiastrum complanatum TaxID=34168 RepID=A0ACC2CV53_DIPCM|nr:hypothetical protein O6H91_08G015400 [Diphasiastrum complanatum]